MKRFESIYRLYSNLYYDLYENRRAFHNLLEAFTRLYWIKGRRINPLFVNGRRMNVHANDPGISTELAIFKVHEPISTGILAKFLRKGHCCLDIGANIGYYALLTAWVIGREGLLVAIEPHPENFNLLLENISMNDLGNMVCFNAACSNYDGYGHMRVTPQSNWHSLVQDGNNGGLQVEVKRVDTLAKGLERLDLMRMDVEGHEYKVIEGSHKTIETFRPYLFIEFHPTLAGKNTTLKLLARLKGYDYEIDYFIPRFLDWPIVGKISHGRKLSIDEYMDRIEKTDPIEGREANVFLKASEKSSGSSSDELSQDSPKIFT